jgi:hypothetical protein
MMTGIKIANRIAQVTKCGGIAREERIVKKLWKRLSQGNRSGQSLLLIIAALPVIVGSLVLVLDVANLYFNQLEMQCASDSGVLAGGAYLPSYPSQAISTATSYAETNGLKASEIVSVIVTPDHKEVIIKATRNIPCFFCAVLGVSTAHAQVSSGSGSSGSGVTTTATSGIVPIRSAIGIVPIGVDYRTDLNFGNPVTLKQNQVGAGNWGPLALGGTGADTYKNNIETGYTGLVTVGDTLLTEPGNVVGPTKQGFDYRINAGTNSFSTGTFNNHALNDPRVMLIPIVDWSNINGRSQVPMKGFAMMWIVSITGNGTINCYFIQQSVPNAIPDPGSVSTSGATTPVLLR